MTQTNHSFGDMHVTKGNRHQNKSPEVTALKSHEDVSPLGDNAKPFCLEDEEQTGGMYDYECKMFFKAHIKKALAELLEGVKQDFKDIKFEGFEVVINKRAEKHFGKSLIPRECSKDV